MDLPAIVRAFRGRARSDRRPGLRRGEARLAQRAIHSRAPRRGVVRRSASREWAITPERLTRIAQLAAPRIERLSDLGPLLAFLFSGRIAMRAGDLRARSSTKRETRQALDARAGRARRVCPRGTRPAIEAVLKSVADALDKKARDVARPFYVAITGSPTSIPLYDSMEMLGRDIVRERLRNALDVLAARAGRVIRAIVLGRRQGNAHEERALEGAARDLRPADALVRPARACAAPASRRSSSSPTRNCRRRSSRFGVASVLQAQQLGTGHAVRVALEATRTARRRPNRRSLRRHAARYRRDLSRDGRVAATGRCGGRRDGARHRQDAAAFELRTHRAARARRRTDRRGARRDAPRAGNRRDERRHLRVRRSGPARRASLTCATTTRKASTISPIRWRISSAAGKRVRPVVAADHLHVLGINDRVELAARPQGDERASLRAAMRDGVTIVDPRHDLSRAGARDRQRHRDLSEHDDLAPFEAGRGLRHRPQHPAIATRRRRSRDGPRERRHRLSRSATTSRSGRSRISAATRNSPIDVHVGNFVEIKKSNWPRASRSATYRISAMRRSAKARTSAPGRSPATSTASRRTRPIGRPRRIDRFEHVARRPGHDRRRRADRRRVGRHERRARAASASPATLLALCRRNPYQPNVSSRAE